MNQALQTLQTSFPALVPGLTDAVQKNALGDFVKANETKIIEMCAAQADVAIASRPALTRWFHQAENTTVGSIAIGVSRAATAARNVFDGVSVVRWIIGFFRGTV